MTKTVPAQAFDTMLQLCCVMQEFSLPTLVIYDPLLVALGHNRRDGKDDSAICAALPTSYRATDQTFQLLGWHSSNKSDGIDRLVETAEKSKLGSP